MTSLSQAESGSEHGGFELHDLVTAVRRRWRWIVVIGATFTVGATVLAFSLTPIYRAEVTVVAAEDEAPGMLPNMLSGLGGVAAIAGIDLGSNADVEVSLATLQSHRFLAAFIEENGLLQEFFAKEWDADAKAWKFPEDAPTMMDGVRMLAQDIMSVSRDRRTGIITLALEWRDRHKAAHWANLMISRVNELLRQQAIEEGGQSIEFLNMELAKTNVVELQQAIHRLTETQINRIMMANVRHEFAFKVIDPAVVPDPKYKVRPRRLVIMMFGAFLGGATGVAIALFLGLRRWRASGSSTPAGRTHERLAE